MESSDHCCPDDYSSGLREGHEVRGWQVCICAQTMIFPMVFYGEMMIC